MLEMANGLSEWGSARLLAIDAPTTRLAAQYENMLERLAGEGGLKYERGSEW